MKKGDIVKLKSGGPSMTILKEGPLNNGKSDNDSYLCVWFTGGVLQDKYFTKSILELITQ